MQQELEAISMEMAQQENDIKMLMESPEPGLYVVRHFGDIVVFPC